MLCSPSCQAAFNWDGLAHHLERTDRGVCRRCRALPVRLDAKQQFFERRPMPPRRFIDCLAQQMAAEAFKSRRIFLVKARQRIKVRQFCVGVHHDSA